MNYYQHHIGDFIRDTARLSDAQCMAYLRMIWMYYETEQPLDDDADAIAFKIGANALDVHQILRHFFFLHDGMWHHSRCDKVLLEYRARSEKAKKSADARWENANAMRTQCERNANASLSDANQEPITNNHKESQKLSSPANAVDPCPHEEIIELYHKHLPMLTRVRIWNDKRKMLLRSRWREDASRQSLDWWADYFKFVATCPWLVGKGKPRNGQAPWQADLEWLVNPNNMTKVIEGKYQEDAA